MGAIATSALSVGSALIGAVVGALITNWYAGRSDRKSAERDRIDSLLKACQKLRSVTTEWYERIAEDIDSSRSPHEISDNLRRLWRGGRFEQEIDNYLKLLRAAPDSTPAKYACSKVIEASSVWREAAFRGKQDAASPVAGRVYMAVATSGELGRLFKYAREGPKQRKLYLDAVQSQLRLSYRDFDEALGDAIAQLAAIQPA